MDWRDLVTVLLSGLFSSFLGIHFVSSVWSELFDKKH